MFCVVIKLYDNFFEGYYFFEYCYFFEVCLLLWDLNSGLFICLGGCFGYLLVMEMFFFWLFKGGIIFVCDNILWCMW